MRVPRLGLRHHLPGSFDEAIVDEETTVPTVDGEEFIDYSEFSYTRSEVFRGCTTWLDVPTLTWYTDEILDRVPFTTRCGRLGSWSRDRERRRIRSDGGRCPLDDPLSPRERSRGRSGDR